MNTKPKYSEKDLALIEVLVRHEASKLSLLQLLLLRWTGLSGWFFRKRIRRNSEIANEYKKLANDFDKEYTEPGKPEPPMYESVLKNYLASKN